MTSDLLNRDVLVVEDIPATVQGLLREIQYRGAVAHRAGSRISANELLKTNTFAAVLVDLNIPRDNGGVPSPLEGRQLIQAVLNGDLGEQHRNTSCYIITAQTIETESDTLEAFSQFSGAFSKMADSRWLLQRLAGEGIIEADEELDFGGEDEVVSARVQLLVTDVLARQTVVLNPVDLEFEKVVLPLDSFPPSIRLRLLQEEIPVLLWATANVAANSPDDLDLVEFSIAAEQVDLDAGPTDWLHRS